MVRLTSAWPNAACNVRHSMVTDGLIFSLAGGNYCVFRVPTHPGKSWILDVAFSRPGKSWNLVLVMESHGI